MRVFKLFVIGFLFLFFTGCAPTVTYRFDNTLYVSDAPPKYNVVVDVFEDVRPTEERDSEARPEDGLAYTSDKIFQHQGNVNKQVSEMLVEHLKKARAFEGVELRDVSNNLYQNVEEMEMLSKQGFDLVIIGKLEHFYGFQTKSSPGGFGVLGVLLEAAANPKNVGGRATYSDIKILDVNDKKILWEGDIEYDFVEKDTLYDGSFAYALRALKETNNKFVMKIKDILP